MMSKKSKERNFNALDAETQKHRDELNKQVYRRKDGILQCPPAYAIGYKPPTHFKRTKSPI
jgi:hypothetical protein